MAYPQLHAASLTPHQQGVIRGRIDQSYSLPENPGLGGYSTVPPTLAEKEYRCEVIEGHTALLFSLKEIIHHAVNVT